MPRPFGSTITLADDVHAQLQALLRARSTPQALALRCRIVLLLWVAERRSAATSFGS